MEAYIYYYYICSQEVRWFLNSCGNLVTISLIQFAENQFSCLRIERINDLDSFNESVDLDCVEIARWEPVTMVTVLKREKMT